MHRPLSLAIRLTLFFGLAAAIVFPIFGWVINREIEAHFEEEDTAEMTIIADAVGEALAGVHSVPDLSPVERRFGDILIGHHSASLYIVDAEGAPVYVSPESPDLADIARGAPADVPDEIRRLDDAHHSYRLLLRHEGSASLPDGGPYTVAVAVPIDYHLRFLASFRDTLWLMVASSIAVMSLMGWLAVRQGHAPLREIVARIRRTSGSELGTRIPPETVPGELSDLAVSFNEMLGRVEDSFQRLTHFNADIAHELRTPITNLMTQTQVALSRARSVDEYREILYSNMEEYDRMAQMVSDMLFLAQADNDTTMGEGADLDVGAEVTALFDYYEGWAEERGVSLVLEGGARVKADRAMLQRALGNLVSNAIRHTPRGGTVLVKLAASKNGRIGIEVQNPGPDIPAEHLSKLFDRFYRVDPSRQRTDAGTGLGLAIVKSIVDAHDGSVDVSSRGGRTTFRVTWPAAESAAA